MINDYKKFLSYKGPNSFWRKAKQIEYNGIEKIQYFLTDGFKKLTTRNSMTLRYLGFIVNKKGDNLEISNAGQTFIDSPYRQKILDEQLFKVYLDCPTINNRISIPIAPVKVMLILLKELQVFTFDEYKLFICWINSYNEVSLVADLIRAFRETRDKEYLDIFNNKRKELGISDFSDNIGRLFNMLMTASYFRVSKDGKVLSTFKKDDLDIILDSFDDSNFSKGKYYSYLTFNDGWHVYSSNPVVRKIIQTLEQVSGKEKEDIVRNIVQSKTLPPLDKVKPQKISLEVKSMREEVEITDKSENKTKEKRKIKIDYEQRDKNNRKYGDFAEEIVVLYEKDKLVKHQDLIEKIKRVSVNDDSLGYDIMSFNEDGTERHIEVKAAEKHDGSFRFFISARELEVARTDKHYHLYVVFEYSSTNPKVFEMPNPFVDQELMPGITMDPIKYFVKVQFKIS